MQEQYAAFLAFYNSAPIACRIRRPEDKGKVESAIKYVKNNFLKNFRGSDYEALVCELKVWNEKICNKHVHGTTRKIPETVFNSIEKQALATLPLRPYQIMQVSTRKVSRMAHISYRDNYYSVPAKYAGMQVRLDSNGTLNITSHAMGLYISQEEHKSKEKRNVSRDEYYRRMSAVGAVCS